MTVRESRNTQIKWSALLPATLAASIIAYLRFLWRRRKAVQRAALLRLADNTLVRCARHFTIRLALPHTQILVVTRNMNITMLVPREI